MPGQRPQLPIDEVLGDIEASLLEPGSNLVVQAAPGAGKTTGLPLSLLREGGFVQRRKQAGLAHHIVVLEPRKLAARMAASTCARWLGESLGQRVGYRVRFEGESSAHTQLLFVTQALYLRMLLGGAIDTTGLVIFDEFHERNMASDLALALTRNLQHDKRPDLQILAMSATIEGEGLASYLDAPVISHAGRSYPVTVHHTTYSRKQTPSLSKTMQALEELQSEGHVLVFVPGQRAMDEQAQSIAPFAKAHGYALHRLHASMSKSAQEQVVAPSKQRKIILATNVAESSVTIPDVTAVVDFGTAKIARQDPLTGKTVLEERKVSQASAIQRSGRAGRTAPGQAFRLYSEADFMRRNPYERAEIERLDPAPSMLTLAALGHKPSSFAWYQAPPEGTQARALSDLEQLGLVHDDQITTIGQLAAQLPLDPMAARCVIELARQDLALAAKVGALLSVDERQLQELARQRPASDTCDVLADLSAWQRARQGKAAGGALSALEQHRRALSNTLSRQKPALLALGPGLAKNFSPQEQPAWIRCCIALGFAANLGKLDNPRQQSSRILLARAKSCKRHESSVTMSDSPWVVVLASRQHATQHFAYRICTIEEEWLLELNLALQTHVTVEFDEDQKRVSARQSLCVGQLEIETDTLEDIPPKAADLLYKKSIAAGFAQFFDPEDLEQLLARCAFVAKHRPDFPVLGEQDVHAAWRELCGRVRSFKELASANFLGALAGQLGEHLHTLDQLAPVSVPLGHAKRVPLRYQGDQGPGISRRLQDFFGRSRGPSVMDGQVPVRLHLLAPNRRDVQVTTDLAGFWERHYPALRKTLMRRYPKHAWPEDPIKAQPPAPRPRKRRD